MGLSLNVFCQHLRMHEKRVLFSGRREWNDAASVDNIVSTEHDEKNTFALFLAATIISDFARWLFCLDRFRECPWVSSFEESLSDQDFPKYVFLAVYFHGMCSISHAIGGGRPVWCGHASSRQAFCRSSSLARTGGKSTLPSCQVG